jgi:hypothetical protein
MVKRIGKLRKILFSPHIMHVQQLRLLVIVSDSGSYFESSGYCASSMDFPLGCPLPLPLPPPALSQAN